MAKSGVVIVPFVPLVKDLMFGRQNNQKLTKK